MSQPSRAFAPLDLALVLLVALIWGVNNVAAKLALNEMPALMVVALRFGIALACLIWFIKPLPSGQWRPMALMLLCVGPLHFGIMFTGLHMAQDLAPMVVAMQLWAPASVVFAALMLKERVGALRWIGVGAAFLGIVAMSFDPIVFAQGWALLIVSGASCLYGLGAVLVRHIGASVGPWVMQAWLAAASAPSLALGSLLFERNQWEQARAASLTAWSAIVFGGVVSGIFATAILFRLMQKYEMARTTPYLLLTPIISFVLGAVVLGDQVTAQIAIGAACALAGVALVALAERRFV